MTESALCLEALRGICSGLHSRKAVGLPQSENFRDWEEESRTGSCMRRLSICGKVLSVDFKKNKIFSSLS